MISLNFIEHPIENLYCANNEEVVSFKTQKHAHQGATKGPAASKAKVENDVLRRKVYGSKSTTLLNIEGIRTD